ncbi:hypothetical protein [Companilactobacillus versmoldensis]|uniref:Uncharacterized protein n=1 Tax=Companilactobacillus versmoldensis DSM 14857 = KCTC 3814 TaxID=1423815 RepID=A0A0R1SEK7_9LACO|nr:hypothetical protein [Companilactobacillus versmoldensis]KRL67821.1 hypothetical protein FC27_GL001357 [Companilactobacillus versmoldensis DSM 14857 = KCTC 3814]
MVLTVLFGELLAILIIVALIQIIKIRWVHYAMYILILASLAPVIFYAINPVQFQFTGSFPFVEKVDTVKADLDDRKPQVSVEDFKQNQSDYDYVTYTELSQNNSLYRGHLIDQWGKVKKVIANDKVGRQIIMDLNESNQSDLVVVDYHLSDLAKGITNIKENDRIKVYGEGHSLDKTGHYPVIDAHFIEYE